jgi:two-component system response regulator VicR
VNSGDPKTSTRDQPTQAEAAAAWHPAPAVPPPLVLIVEDEAPIAEAIAMIVADEGYEPLIAAHALQGLELVRSRRPALITTDYMMPNMNGDEFIDLVRQEAVAKEVAPPPIILITAVASQRVRKINADAFLPKPFNIDDLSVLLHRFLDSADSSQNGAQP